MRYLTIMVIILFQFLIKTSSAQPLYQKIFGDTVEMECKAVAEVSGMIYVAGKLIVDSTNIDIFWMKLDSNGNALAGFTYGGVNIDAVNAMIATQNGELLIVGATSSFGQGESDVYITRIDTQGNIIWSNTYGDTLLEEANSVYQTLDGGFILTGFIDIQPFTDSDPILLKIDGGGNLVWSKRLVGDGTEAGTSIIQTADSGYVLTGYTTSSGADKTDVLLAKTDQIGNLQFVKFYGGSEIDFADGIAESNEGDFVMVGTTNSFGANNNDLYILKTSNLGVLNWSKKYSGGGAPEEGLSVITTKKSYYFGGSTASFGIEENDLFLLTTDSAGTFSDFVTYGGAKSDISRGIFQTLNEQFVIYGSTNGFGLQERSAWIIKADNSGASGCLEVYDIPAINNASTVSVTDTNITSQNVSMIQAIAATVKTAFSVATNNPTFPQAGFSYTAGMLFASFHDLSIRSFDDTIVWYYGDGKSDTAVKNPNHVYDSAGTYKVCVEVANACGYDSICKSVVILPDTNVGGMDDHFAYLHVAIAPNPVDRMLGIKIDAPSNENIYIRIYNAYGALVYSQLSTGTDRRDLRIDMSPFKNGLYYILFKTKEGSRTEKIVVCR